MREVFRQYNLRRLIILALFFVLCPVAFAQHEGHTMPAKPAAKTKPKPPPKTAPKPPPKDSKPGENQEAASPTPTPSPSPKPETIEKEKTAMPDPAAKPVDHKEHPQASTTPTPEAPAKQEHPVSGHPEKDTGTTPHGSASESDSLLLMSGDRISIRVGLSSLNTIPMGQIGSGTSWQPASTQMNMLHKMSGDWLLMFHYNTVVGLNAQGGPRGVTKLESQNWFMPMALRRVGKGTLELRGMLSMEPFTFPPGGSPLLFQTGETYQGELIIDRQHPHDLFMELSATYIMPLGDRATWFTYLGYPGEPALGPTAFMHRASASENPSAPLSHHLQDSSHISFGVVTTGFSYGWFKIEGSIFNGREPGENRYNFEANPWNSRSARLSFAPNDNWSMQISHGFLRNPEALEPGDVRRTTASISYNRPFERGNWATSLIWGRNHESHGDDIFNLNGYVAESTVNFLDKNYLYTRLELTDKNQLLRPADRFQLGIDEHHPSFRIGAYTFGAARDLWSTEKLLLAIGGDLTFYSKPATLDPIYDRDPKSFRIFFRMRPGKMNMSSHDMSGGGKQ